MAVPVVSIVGDVVNDGLLVFNRSDTLGFGGAISGTGAVHQRGTGTLVLTGANTHGGGTTIDDGGTLQLGNGGTTGAIVGDVVNDGLLVFNRSNALGLSGIISGSGAVNQAGPGATVLTGNNTYSGATTVSAGALIVDGDQSAATGTTTASAGTTLGGTGTSAAT